MDEKNKILTFEDYLAKYPELMGVRTLEEFDALLADLPEKIPHDLWDIIEPTIVERADISIDHPQTKKKTPERKKAPSPYANKAVTHISGTVKPKSLEENPEYIRLRNDRKREWFENRPGIDEDAFVARAYFNNLETDSNHPVDTLFPFKKVHSDFEEEIRKEFFQLHPQAEKEHKEFERTHRYNNPIEDPTYLGFMLTAKKRAREWYDRQLSEGITPSPTQLEHQFSIERAKALATFQNEHPLKADIYQEQFGSVEKAVSQARKETEGKTSSETEAPQESTTYLIIDESARKDMPLVSFSLPSTKLRKDQEYIQFREALRNEKIRVWERDHPDKKPSDRVYDAKFTSYFDRNPETGDLPFYEDAERIFRGMRPEKAAAYDALERRRVYNDPFSDPVFVQYLKQSSKAAENAVREARKANPKITRPEEERIYLVERYRYSLTFHVLFPEKAAGYAKVHSPFTSVGNYRKTVGEKTRLFSSSSTQHKATGESYDDIFKSVTGGAVPSSHAEKLPFSKPQISPSEETEEWEEEEASDNRLYNTSGSTNYNDARSERPDRRREPLSRRAREAQRSINRARQRIQNAKKLAERGRKVAQLAQRFEKAAQVARVAGTFIASPEFIVVVIIILVILLFFIIFSSMMSSTNIEQRRGYIDDRTLARVSILKQGPSIVTIPRKLVPLPDDPFNTEPDWDKVYVTYRMNVTYPGIAEDVIIAEAVPEGTEIITNDDPTTPSIEETTEPFKRLDENGEAVRNNRDTRVIEWSLKDLQDPVRVATPNPSQPVRNVTAYTNPPYNFPAPSGTSDTTYSDAELTRLNELGGRVRKYDSYLLGIVNSNSEYTDPFLSVIWAGAIAKTGGDPYYWKCGSRRVNDGCSSGAFSSGEWLTGHAMPVNKATDSLYSVFAAVYGVSGAENPDRVREIGQRVVDFSGSSPLGGIQNPITFPSKRLGLLIDEAKAGNSEAQQAVAILLMDPDIAALSLARMIALDISRNNDWASTLRGYGYSDIQTYANRLNAIIQKYSGTIVGKFDSEEIVVTFKIPSDMWIANTAVGTVIGAQRTDDRSPSQLPNDENCNGFYTLNNKIHKNFGDPGCDYKSDKDKAKQELIARLGADNPDVNKWALVVIPCESGYNANAYASHESIGTPDKGGAWGMFQMGSCIDAPGSGCDGKNGPYDKGDVNWQLQIRNAVEYNRILERNRRKWQYWACAKRYWGQP